MSYHWADMAVLWAALEHDYDAVNSLLNLYTTEALQELASICVLIQNKADNIYFKRQDAIHEQSAFN